MFRQMFIGAATLVGLVAIAPAGSCAHAAEITVLSAVAMKPALDDLVREFERRSGVVPAGAPKPDISTVDALKHSLLAAKSIVYPDPAKGGATGIHAARVIERLGIAAEMKPKTTLVPGSEYAEILAKRQAEMGIVQPMVVLGVPGVELVGPLPTELQNTTDFVFWAGVGAASNEADTASAFIMYLLTPEAARAIKAKGMEPGSD